MTMPKQMQCPCCNTLDLRLKMENGYCVVCGGSHSIDADKSTVFMNLAEKLNKHTQIPHQYFEIGNLFLRNVSLTEDPSRNQVFAIYRKRSDGGFAKIDIIGVNNKSPELVCALLLRFDELSIEHFKDEIRIYDDQVTAEELEAFKERFQDFAAAY